MDVDLGSVMFAGAVGDGTGDFTKKHSLAKGLALDISVGLPHHAEDVVSAGLPLQSVLVQSAKVDYVAVTAVIIRNKKI